MEAVVDAVVVAVVDAGLGVRPRCSIRDFLFFGAGDGVLMGDAAVVVGVNGVGMMLLLDAVVDGCAARDCRDAESNDDDDDDDANFLLHDG